MTTDFDPELTRLLEDVGEFVDADIESGAGAPDLAAVVAMAHRMDPERIDAAAVEEVQHYAAVVPLKQARRLRATRDDPQLDAVATDVRAFVDQDITRTLAQPTKRAEPLPRRGVVWVGVLLAASALLGLGYGALRWVELERDRGEPSSAAMVSPQSPVDKPSEAQRSPPPPPEIDSDPSPPPEPLPAVESDLKTRDAPTTPRRRPRTRRPAPPRPEALKDRLARLEREADEAWSRRAMAEAEALYREIIRLDRSGRWAQNAYGELFTLARQRQRSPEPLWRAYLTRFPKGRFADDARAGLCRRAQGAAKPTCWREYLDTMPRGSFRAQAQRELDASAQQEEP